MKNSRIVQYLACFTIILTLLSLFSESSLAERVSSDNGNGNKNQFIREDTRSSYENETDNVDEANSFKSEKQEQNLSAKSRNNISEYKQERNQLKEELQFHKQEYKVAKGDFLMVRNRIRADELDPNSKRP